VSVESVERARLLLERMDGTASPEELNKVGTELGALMHGDPDVVRFMDESYDELCARFDDARIRLAGVVAKGAAISLIANAAGFARIVPPKPHPEFAAGGPASEVALAALHFLRNASDVVPLRPEQIEEALEESESDPDFADYQQVFAATVGHLSTASYYLLDAHDVHAALESEPPVQETFPPLPFPRIWIEMAHLQPYLRFEWDTGDEEGGRLRVLDVLGVGIAEIEQGSVWDVFVPFMFDDRAEFFVIGQRIAPGHVVAMDGEMMEASFVPIRNLAVGGVHLITARNVPVEDVVLPRPQRKRLLREGVLRAQPRVYFVNLAASGEHGASYGGGREYHCRWLVRGHWRHIDGGRRFCTCCDPPQIASWVDPYVKGPTGAPWKGRQVRVQHVQEATA